MSAADFRKIGTAYRLRVDDGCSLWIKRHQRSRRYQLIHEYRDPTGRRCWGILGSYPSVDRAAREAHALLDTEETR